MRQGGQKQARISPSLPKHPQNSTGTLRRPLHSFLFQEPESRKFKLALQNGFSFLSTGLLHVQHTRQGCPVSLALGR